MAKKTELELIKEQFKDNKIEIEPSVIVNGTTYTELLLRAPTTSEVMANMGVLDSESTTRNEDMLKLTKLCIQNLAKPMDFDAFPFKWISKAMLYVAFQLG